MDYSIVYSSRTGNTKALAEAIKEALLEDSCLYFGKSDDKYIDAPLVFIGFWTDKGSCDGVAIDFLKTLTNKTVFIFGTAGFDGGQEYYEKILKTAQQHLDCSNTILGTYMCQGKMPMAIRQRYEKMLKDTPADSNLKKQIENFDCAASHPDKNDCDRLKSQVLKKIF